MNRKRTHLLAGEGQYEQVFLGKKRLSGRDFELASVVSASGRYQACLRSSVGTLGVPGAKKILLQSAYLSPGRIYKHLFEYFINIILAMAPGYGKRQ